MYAEGRMVRRANLAYIRRSRPDSDLGFQVKVLIAFLVVPSSLGSGLGCKGRGCTAGTCIKGSNSGHFWRFCLNLKLYNFKITPKVAGIKAHHDAAARWRAPSEWEQIVILRPLV